MLYLAVKLQRSNICYICVADDEEKEIMVSMFEFAKDLVNLQLTETELALICAVVLIDPCKLTINNK